MSGNPTNQDLERLVFNFAGITASKTKIAW